MMFSLTKENVERNLIDIGCKQDQIQRFITDFEHQDLYQMLRFLKWKRMQLLDDIHQQQKQIDYLDYLVYQLKKKGEEK